MGVVAAIAAKKRYAKIEKCMMYLDFDDCGTVWKVQEETISVSRG
jgi:hypothetical protein